MSFENKVAKMRDFYMKGGRTEPERIATLCRKMDDLLNAKPNEKPRMIPEDFSIQEIHQAVHPSAFPLVTGKLISKKMMDAYELADTIGDQLVETMPSNLLIDRVPGFKVGGAINPVLPGGPYQHTGYLEEKWVQIAGQKYGKILDITWEIIKFDQTGSILRIAGKIGEGAKMYRERLILNTIQDITGYKKWLVGSADAESVTQTDLYSTSTTSPHRTSNLITNALVNHDDINAAVVLFGLLVDDSEQSEPIVVTPKILLVPVALDMRANMIYKSTVLIGGANAQPNPYAGKFTPKSSPFLDAQSTTAWYLGDFRKQFVWKEVIPIQVLTRMDEENDMAWERDVKAQYKIRFYGECAATDYCYVVKSSGTV